ncbi:MAG: hypothetical protein U0807_14815 [Candidatus Binatia bacterium]
MEIPRQVAAIPLDARADDPERPRRASLLPHGTGDTLERWL